MCAIVCMQRFATFILIVLVILHLNQNKFTFQEILRRQHLMEACHGNKNCVMTDITMLQLFYCGNIIMLRCIILWCINRFRIYVIAIKEHSRFAYTNQYRYINIFYSMQKVHKAININHNLTSRTS